MTPKAEGLLYERCMSSERDLFPPLEEEKTVEEIVLDIQAGRDQKENLSRLWEQVRPFVCQIANRYGAGDETEDLIQEGFFGIMDAVRKWDVGQGAKFLTFAEYDIRNRLTRYLASSGSVKLPAGMADAVRKCKKVVAEFEKAHGREPSDLETAFLMGLKIDRAGRWVKKLDRIRNAAKQTTSLDAPVTEDGLTLADTMTAPGDMAESIVDAAFTEQMKAAVWEEVDRLPQISADIIRARYENSMTLEEAAEQLGLKRREAVRILEAKAMRMLRKPESLARLKPYCIDLYGISARGNIGGFFRSGMSSTERAAFIDMGEYWKEA